MSGNRVQGDCAPPTPVLAAIRAETDRPPTPGVSALVERIRENHGEALLGVIFYGSVLRTGDVEHGLLDLMAVVDAYRPAYGGSVVPAVMNRMLPPNVFYLEAPLGEGTVRCKYTITTRAQMEDHVEPSCRQVYYWGRLAQPCGIAWSRDDEARDALQRILARAVTTFASTVAPILPERFDHDALWIDGLTKSYGTELRAERRGVAERLVATAPDRYRVITMALAAELGWRADDDGAYRLEIPDGERARARFGWSVRRLQGKALNLARLVKAVFTFKGGVDYALWKIERHSGVRVEVSDLARRHPLIAGWPTLWKLYRLGAFR